MVFDLEFTYTMSTFSDWAFHWTCDMKLSVGLEFIISPNCELPTNRERRAVVQRERFIFFSASELPNLFRRPVASWSWLGNELENWMHLNLPSSVRACNKMCAIHLPQLRVDQGRRNWWIGVKAVTSLRSSVFCFWRVKLLMAPASHKILRLDIIKCIWLRVAIMYM